MPSNRPPPTVNRREFLATAGATVGASLPLAGCSGLIPGFGGPSLQWRTPLGARSRVNSPLAFLEGRLLATSGTHLHAIDARSGDRLWQSGVVFDHVTTGPVIDDDVAVVADTMRAAFRTDGTTVWSRDGTDDFRPFAALEDSLVVGASNTASGAITAIDVTDGRIQWRVTPSEWDNTNGNYAAYDAVATENGLVAVDFNGPLSGLSPDGSVRWTRDDWDTPGPGRPRLTASRETAVVASGAIIAIDPQSGDVRWRHVLPDWASGIAMSTQTVYVALGSDSPKVGAWDAPGGVIAFDLSDGNERWRTRFQSPAKAPAKAGGDVLVGTAEGRLIGINGRTGTHRWELSVGSRVATAPLIGDDAAFVGVRNAENSPAIVAVS